MLNGINVGNDVTRKYYKGKSFRWAGYWKPGEHYFNDEYIVDFVSIEGAMCVCEVTHFSSESNKPTLKYDEKGNVVGLENTKLWQISLVGAGGSSNGAVRFDVDQHLEDAHKIRARINIGAVSQEEVATTVDDAVSALSARILPVDEKVSESSTNPIQNKAIKGYVDETAKSLTAQITRVDDRLTDLKDTVGDLKVDTGRIVNEAVTEEKLSKDLQAKITFDTALSEKSEKAVQNKVITKAINDLSARITPLESAINNIDALESRVTTVEQNLT